MTFEEFKQKNFKKTGDKNYIDEKGNKHIFEDIVFWYIDKYYNYLIL